MEASDILTWVGTISGILVLFYLVLRFLPNEGGLQNLVRPAWKNSDERVRQAAAERATNQSVLAKIAQNKDENLSVREAAMARVTNQSVLAKIAQNKDENLSVREAAMARVTDQEILADVAKNVAETVLLRSQSLDPGAANVLIAIVCKSPHLFRDKWDKLASLLRHSDIDGCLHSDNGFHFPPKPTDF